MLKHRANISAHPPGKCLRLGAFELDVTSRELRRVGARRGRRLTHKAMLVLIALSQKPGEVVSRDDLMTAVWPDTYPTGDVLTQAIVSLRRALDDQADKPGYIETVAKSGYRLLVACAWQSELPVSEAQQLGAASPSLRSRRGRILMLGGVAFALVACMFLLLVWTVASPDLEARAEPESVETLPAPASARLEQLLLARPAKLTSHVGRESMPRLSPDGQWLTFVADWDDTSPHSVFLQSTTSHDSRLLLAPPRAARIEDVRWSPSGSSLAVVEVGGGEGEGCRLLIVPVLGGTPRMLGDCDRSQPFGVDWLDEHRLVLGGPVLQVLDLRSGRRTGLDAPQGGGWEIYPRVSPDGSWVVFRLSGAASRLWYRPANGGGRRPLTSRASDLHGINWTPDSKSIVFSRFSHEGYAWSLASVGFPGGAERSLSMSGSSSLDLARSDWSLVASTEQTKARVTSWEAGDSTRLPQLFASSSSSFLAAADPTGKRIAFSSDRTGSLSIWLLDLSNLQPALRRVADLDPMPRFAPSWALDGRSFFLVATGPEGEGLYEVDTHSLTRRLVVPNSGMRVQYGEQLDNFRFHVGGRCGARDCAGVWDVQVAQWETSPRNVEYSFARRVRESGTLLASAMGVPGLFKVHGDGTTERVEGIKIAGDLYKAWDVLDGDVWFLGPADQEPESRPPELALWRASLANPAETLRRVSRLDGQYLPVLSVLPGGQAALLTSLESTGSDVEHLSLADTD